jgi:NADH-quinone oxidoreductase subunit C
MSDEDIEAGQKPDPEKGPEGKPKKPVTPAAGAGEPEKDKPAKPVQPKRPVKKGPSYEELTNDPLLADLQQQFGSMVVSGQAFLDQPIYTVVLPGLLDILLYLRESPKWSFDYLVDLTALDYPGDPQRFCLVYHLYSHKINRLIRVKARVAEDETAPSVVGIWQTADWLERETYDMFGIEFAGHPDLRRILLPDDWLGYPLRKDYDIKLQDQAWIRKHLRIRKIPE